MWGANVRFGFGARPPLDDEEAATPLLGQREETGAPHQEEQEGTRTAQLVDQDTTGTPRLSHRNIATRSPSSLPDIATTPRSSLPDITITSHMLPLDSISTAMAEDNPTIKNTLTTDVHDPSPPPEDSQDRERADPEAEWNPEDDRLFSALKTATTSDSLSTRKDNFANHFRESIASSSPGIPTRDCVASSPTSPHYGHGVDVMGELGDGTAESSTHDSTNQLMPTHATDETSYEMQKMLLNSFAAKKARQLPLLFNKTQWDQRVTRAAAEKRASLAEEAVVSDEGSDDEWLQDEMQRAIALSLRVGDSNGDVEEQVTEDVQEQGAKEGDEHALPAQPALRMLPQETQPNGPRGRSFSESSERLRTGWTQHSDRTGQLYYVKRKSGQTTRERPVALDQSWWIAQCRAANERSAQVVESSSHRSAPISPQRDLDEPFVHCAKRRALSDDDMPGEVGDDLEGIPSQQAGSSQTSAYRDIGHLLDDVRDELETLRATTPGSPPAYYPNMQARSHAQVLRARLVPIGNHILEVLRVAPQGRSRGLELRLCRYIAENYWPLPLTPTTQIDIQHIYRAAQFLQRFREADESGEQVPGPCVD